VNDDNYASSEQSGAQDNAPVVAQVEVGEVETNEVAQNSVLQVARAAIVPNPHQPRHTFERAQLEDLAASIRTHGIMQPLVVTQISPGKYELIAGERRFRASQLAGLDKVPVIVRTASTQDKLELALIENIQRHDLNVIEEARGYAQLIENFGLLQDEVAMRMGKSRSVVTNRLRLLKLPVSIIKLVSGGQLSDGHAKVILSLESTEAQYALAQMIVAERLTVRQAEARAAAVRRGNSNIREQRTPTQLPVVTRTAQNLTRTLGTKVTITPRGRGGRINIEYYAPEDLRNLEEKISSSDVDG
jgi:ParB family chromosome partitioning protein